MTERRVTSTTLPRKISQMCMTGALRLGGGIFEFLPIASERDVFEEHVVTPHGLDFAHAAALYGCGHSRVESLGAFGDQLDATVAGGAVSIIEVRTDRAENLALHRRMPGGPDFDG